MQLHAAPDRIAADATAPAPRAGHPVAKTPRFRAARRRLAALLAGLALILGGVALAQGPLTLLTHESFDIGADVLAAFTDATGIEVEIVPLGDAGAAVNRVVLTRRAPLGDLLYGVDNALFARAARADVFVPYASPRLDAVPDALEFDPAHRVTPVDVGYVNFNYDVGWFEQAGLAPPSDLDDLVSPAYRGLTAVQNPTSSSPGLAFLLTTIARYGEGAPGDWLDFWRDLVANDVAVFDGWSDAYYTAFTRYGGDRPIVLSYASSPAAEVMFAEEALDAAPTANLLCTTCVWRQIEAVGILAGSDRVDDARAFVDFMLSIRFQEDIPGRMFVYPAIEGASLPAEFDAHAPVPAPEQIASLAPDVIADGQPRWLEQWIAVVERGRDPGEVR